MNSLSYQKIYFAFLTVLVRLIEDEIALKYQQTICLRLLPLSIFRIFYPKTKTFFELAAFQYRISLIALRTSPVLPEEVSPMGLLISYAIGMPSTAYGNYAS